MTAQIRRPLRHRISPALIIMLAALGATAQAQSTLFTYTFADMVSGGTSSAGATASNVEFGSVTSTGVSAVSNAGNVFSFTGWSIGATTGSDTFAGAIDLTDYYSLTITPETGYTLDLDSITFDVGRSATGPRQFSVRSGADAFTANIPASPGTNTATFSVVPTDIFQIIDTTSSGAQAGPTLTFGSAFDALTNALTLRFYAWNAESVNGSFRIDNLAIVGTSTLSGVPGRNLLWSPITGIWDTTSLHWNDGVTAVAFQDNDKATFDDSGLVNGATVTIQAAGVTIGNTKVTNTTGTYTFVGGAISGSGSLTKTGAGSLVLSAPNAYTGGTVVTEGTVVISDDAQLGAATAPVTLGTAGTLETTGSLTLNASRPVTGTGTLKIAPATTLNIAGTANTGPLTLSTIGSLLLSGATSAQIGGFNIQQPINIAATQPILLGGSIVTTNTTGTFVVAAPLGLGTAMRVFNIADGSAAIDASITGNISSTSTGGRLHKLGDGTLELLGDNSGLLGGVRLGTAGATPVNGGTLIVGSATSLGPGGVGTSGQFQFNAGILRATAAIQFPSTLALSIGGSSPLLTTFAGSDVEFLGATSLFLTGAAPHILIADSNVRFASAITGSTAGLTVRGAGSLTLAAGGTFTGDLAVESGKLYITGNVAGALPVDNRPAITVTNGGLLGGSVSGSDSLGGLTALGAPGTPGTISPGTVADSTAILTVTSLTVLAEGFLALEIAGLADHDQLAVNGAVNLGGGGLNLSLINGYTPALGDAFTVILNDASEPIADTFSDKAENSIFSVGSSFFLINYAAGDGNDVVLTAVVPEPGSAALLLGGLGLLGIRRRKN